MNTNALLKNITTQKPNRNCQPSSANLCPQMINDRHDKLRVNRGGRKCAPSIVRACGCGSFYSERVGVGKAGAQCVNAATRGGILGCAIK